MKQPVLYMAPLKGITDHLFRTVFTEHFGGFDLAVAPFISSKRDRKIKSKYVKDVLPENNLRLPVIPQILSNTADDFIHLADYLFDLGYDTVNWNLGCPFPTVTKKKRGSGLLPHTDMIRDFLDTAVPGMHGKLSIKIRLGFYSCDELFALMPILNQYPLADLIIHPRTGVQRYDGAVDLEAFERCVAQTNHRIVYNGDIKTLRDFELLSNRFPGVHRWMIGRWCLSSPFLPLRIQSGRDGITNKIDRIKRFHEALFDAYSNVMSGPSHVLNKMKGLWRYLSLPFEDFSKSMKQIKKTTRPDQYLERVNRFFENEAVLDGGDGGDGAAKGLQSTSPPGP